MTDHELTRSNRPSGSRPSRGTTPAWPRAPAGAGGDHRPGRARVRHGELAAALGKPSEGAARIAVHRALLRLAEEMRVDEDNALLASIAAAVADGSRELAGAESTR